MLKKVLKTVSLTEKSDKKRNITTAKKCSIL